MFQQQIEQVGLEGIYDLDHIKILKVLGARYALG